MAFVGYCNSIPADCCSTHLFKLTTMTEANAPAYVRHKEYLLVTVPEANGVREFYLLDSHNNHKTTQALFWKDNTPSPPWVLLPPGSWQLIGLAAELTEEQCDCIVGGPALEHEGNRLYQPWTNEIEGHYSASENLSDLLRSHTLNANQVVILKLIQP